MKRECSDSDSWLFDSLIQSIFILFLLDLKPYLLVCWACPLFVQSSMPKTQACEQKLSEPGEIHEWFKQPRGAWDFLDILILN